MKLTRVFDQLRYGTLKGQAVSREGAQIEELDYPRLITCVNSAMTVLYDCIHVFAADARLLPISLKVWGESGECDEK